jgi:hypothetical protein
LFETKINQQNKMPERVDFVMKKFMQIIPETETNLRSKISNYLENNIWNKAPEILNGYDLWMDLFHILKYNIGEMDAEWKQEILKIYNEAKV